MSIDLYACTDAFQTCIMYSGVNGTVVSMDRPPQRYPSYQYPHVEECGNDRRIFQRNPQIAYGLPLHHSPEGSLCPASHVPHKVDHSLTLPGSH